MGNEALFRLTGAHRRRVWPVRPPSRRVRPRHSRLPLFPPAPGLESGRNRGCATPPGGEGGSYVVTHATDTVRTFARERLMVGR